MFPKFKDFQEGMAVKLDDRVGGGTGVVVSPVGPNVFLVQITVDGYTVDRSQTYNACWLSLDTQKTPEIGDTVKCYWMSDDHTATQSGVVGRISTDNYLVSSEGSWLNVRRDQHQSLVQFADFVVVVEGAQENPFKLAKIGSLTSVNARDICYKLDENLWRVIDKTYNNFGHTYSDQEMLEGRASFLNRV